VFKIINDLPDILYPQASDLPTGIQEGKILSRILLSSCVDSFEGYLSDLLYEIYLANPYTLKSKQEVTVEEVLNCIDIQDFVRYYAKQKIHKLQKGSVKGFIKENKQISALQVLDEPNQHEIENILQIRHLYSHRNGIVDDKFQGYFPMSQINTEYCLSIVEIGNIIVYLAEVSHLLDESAIEKYSLATV